MDTSGRTQYFTNKQEEDCASAVLEILGALRHYCRSHLKHLDGHPTIVQQQKLNMCLYADLFEKPLRLSCEYDRDGLYQVIQKVLGKVEDKVVQGLVRRTLLDRFGRDLGDMYLKWLERQNTLQPA